jgi:uncharacterized protein (DUF58 family)
VLASAELALLRRLRIVRRRPAAGLYPGEHRSRRASRSPEFSDFRAYVPGDDFRHLDWRAFGRLERLLLRLYVAEDEVCLNLVVDASASMATGAPAKWAAVRRLAAALTFLGLAGMDRVAVGVLRRGGEHTGHLRGSSSFGLLERFLGRIRPGGEGGLEDLLTLQWLKPGITVVISDFLSEGESASPPRLGSLRDRGQELVLWQLLAPDEASPELVGDVRLVGPERGRERELTVTAELVKDYLGALRTHQGSLAGAAQTGGGSFLSSLSSDDLLTLMRRGVAAGIIRQA